MTHPAYRLSEVLLHFASLMPEGTAATLTVHTDGHQIAAHATEWDQAIGLAAGALLLLLQAHANIAEQARSELPAMWREKT